MGRWGWADWHVTLVQSSMTSTTCSQSSESHHPLFQDDQWIFLGYIFNFHVIKKMGHSVYMSCDTHILILLKTSRNTILHTTLCL